MKPSVKMGVIILIGVCLIFFEYHLSGGVRFDQLVNQLNDVDSAASYGAVNIAIAQGDECTGSYKFAEEKVREVIQLVQNSNGLSPEIGNTLIQELTNQLDKVGVLIPTKIVEQSTKQLSSIDDETTLNTAESSAPTSKLVFKKANSSTLEPLYIITPTYKRPEQIPELIRMSHTLMHVENVHWLVIEDAKLPTKEVTQFLRRTGLTFEHLTAPMPEKYKQKRGAKPRGVSNRNRGLKWIRANATSGVFYFADDDNTYDLDLFEEIRYTKKVSMFPVGLCTRYGLSSPVVKNGKFVGFYDGWVAGRKFPVDMAGFAVSVKFLLQRPNASMPYRAGFEEDGFLKNLAPFEPREIELLANNCTKILAWHTQTKKNEPSAPLDMKIYRSTNLVELKKQIV